MPKASVDITSLLPPRITDHWCACGRLATFAYPNSAGRDVWHCLDAYGRA